MKLRRALAAVATTAAIAPAALMTASPVFAADASSAPSTSSSASQAPGTPGTSVPAVSATLSATPTAVPGDATGVPSDTPTQLAFCADKNPAYKASLAMSISGLPGRIARGSGWHPFTLTLANPSKATLKDVQLAAGVGPMKGEDPYSLGQARLQAYDPDAKVWFDVTQDGTTSFGSLGPADLPAGTPVKVALRLDVTAKAPLGKGLTIALGIYPDRQNDCTATSFAAYKLEIVRPGTRTSGSKPVPQTGGKAPLPAHAPSTTGKTHVVPASVTTAAATTTPATGALAHTGSSSALPVIAGVGGAAVVVGAGAVYVVRRRRNGGVAA